MVVRFSFGLAGFESRSPDVVAAAATEQKPTQPGRGQFLAVGSTGAKKANGGSHVELCVGIWVPPRLASWVELSALSAPSSALAALGRMLAAERK